MFKKAGTKCACKRALPFHGQCHCCVMHCELAPNFLSFFSFKKATMNRIDLYIVVMVGSVFCKKIALFLSAYLDTLYNFHSESVSFYYHMRSTSENIQVQRLECPAKAKIGMQHKRGGGGRPHDA